jgi:kumamolisin
MTRSFYVSVFTGAALATMMIMAPSAMASPGAATPSPSPSSQVPVQQGTDVASLPGATAFGDTPPDTPETVSFILRERNLPQLKAAVEHGVTNFLSVGQFAAT